MKPKTIEEIYREVEKEMTPEKFYKRAWPRKPLYDNIWPEVCKRYAIEVAKATLESASVNALMRNEGHGKRYYTTGDSIDIESIECGIISIEKSSITDEQNIVL